MCPSGYGHAIRRDCQRLENVGQEDVLCEGALCEGALCEGALRKVHPSRFAGGFSKTPWTHPWGRSEEHTSELQSRGHLVCRLLLEKKSTGRHPSTVLQLPVSRDFNCQQESR